MSGKKSRISGKNGLPIKGKASRRNSKTIWYAILISILTFLVFSNSLQNGFVKNFDDIIYLSSAESLRNLSHQDIGTIFSSSIAGIYHPLSVLSLAVEVNLFGSGAFHFHFFNLLLHVCNVLLVFWFIFILTKRVDIAVIVALFFGIHPMHVESVTWISERKDLLYTFFFISALIAYLKYQQNNVKYKYLVYSLILFIFSLLSKSAAVSLAPLIVLIDYYNNRKFDKKTILEKIPFFLLALIFGIISLWSQSEAGATSAMEGLSYNFSFTDKIFLISHSIMFYISKIVWPFNLSAIHYYPSKIEGQLPIMYYLSPLGIALLVFLIIKLRKIRKTLVFGFLFFIITILLVLQFIPVGYSIVSERYSYVPYIGMFFIIGKLYSDYCENSFGNYSTSRRNTIIFILSLFVLLFSIQTFQRNKVWQNGVTLFDDVIESYPENGHAYWGRGTGKSEMKDYQGACLDFEAALRNNFTYASVYNSLGKSYVELDLPEKAINAYDFALKKDSTLALAYYNRAHAKQLLQDFLSSIPDYKKSIEYKVINPGMVYNELGLSQFKVNDFKNALNSMDSAIVLDPEYAADYSANRLRIEKAMEQALRDSVY